MANRLQGIRVLVTRPTQQAAGFSAAIEAEAGAVVQLPALEIQPNDDALAHARCGAASDYDWVIFISQNAVQHALPHLPLAWPSQTRIAAIGQATADALMSASLNVDVLPGNGSNSESMLEALASKDLSGQRILIVRGKGGRETLAKGLSAQGAKPEYAEVYRRACPDVGSADIKQVMQQGVDIITIASGETLVNFSTIIKNAAADVNHSQDLLDLPLVVASSRIAKLVAQSGFTGTVVVAPHPGAEGFINAIENWHNSLQDEAAE